MGKAIRRNPEEAAAAKFVEFHGQEADKIFEFKSRIHEHEWLSGIGKLEMLDIRDLNGEARTMQSFRGTLVAQNEEGNQLFLSGGDQGVDVEEYGVERVSHELELLGTLTDIFYFTTKVHLVDKDGGTAVYHHTFGGSGKRRPVVVYDVLNKQLLIVGGDYEILPEGILN